MTETEQKVINILISTPPTSSRAGAIQQVAAKMHWINKDTAAFVESLRMRGLVEERTNAVDVDARPKQRQRWWWVTVSH